jgi:TonB family protein
LKEKMSNPMTGYPDPRQNPIAPPSESEVVGRILALQEQQKPWFVTIFSNIRDVINPPKQDPLQVSFRPLSEEELLHSSDPYLASLARLDQEHKKSYFQCLGESLKLLFSNEQLPAIQLTSRPLTEEELRQATGLAELEKTSLPWYRTFLGNLKDLLFPEKLPPLELTSRPVQVRELFEKDKYAGRSGVMSLAIHVGLVTLAFLLGTNKTIQSAVKNTMPVFSPVDIAPYQPQAAPKKQAMGGGGGGGDRSPLPASKGKLPRQDLKQFTPPMAVVNNPNPKLIMEPTIIVPPDVTLPNVNMAQYGDPTARIGPPSNGPGSGGGIGSGSGGGVGPGRGGGFGPGEGGGAGGGAFRIGGGVSAPVPIYKVEPEYSEEARKAKFQGTVLLSIVVDETGKTTNVRVVRPLGMGLDEKAIEAVLKWRFRPGYKEGRPVAVMANVEVNFRLL